MVVYLIWRARRPVEVVVLVLALVLSRVYAGEHWPTDVVGGWVLGAAWLLVLIAAQRSARL